jgi:hypothetical protein
MTVRIRLRGERRLAAWQVDMIMVASKGMSRDDMSALRRVIGGIWLGGANPDSVLRCAHS